MSLFRSSLSSPASTVSDLEGKAQDVKSRFLTVRGELVKLLIPMMKETLVKIDDFLDLCKKDEGEQAPIYDVLNLLIRLLNDVLNPVLNEKRRGEVRITEVLPEQFRTFFKDLHNFIPIKPSPSWDRMFRSVYGGAVVTSAFLNSMPLSGPF